MPIVLDSDDIIELFAHSDQVGQNSQGVYIVPCAHKPPESFFFISEHGLEPIKKAISKSLDGPIEPPSGTKALDSCRSRRRFRRGGIKKNCIDITTHQADVHSVGRIRRFEISPILVFYNRASRI